MYFSVRDKVESVFFSFSLFLLILSPFDSLKCKSHSSHSLLFFSHRMVHIVYVFVLRTEKWSKMLRRQKKIPKSDARTVRDGYAYGLCMHVSVCVCACVFVCVVVGYLWTHDWARQRVSWLPLSINRFSIFNVIKGKTRTTNAPCVERTKSRECCVVAFTTVSFFSMHSALFLVGSVFSSFFPRFFFRLIVWRWAERCSAFVVFEWVDGIWNNATIWKMFMHSKTVVMS